MFHARRWMRRRCAGVDGARPATEVRASGADPERDADIDDVETPRAETEAEESPTGAAGATAVGGSWAEAPGAAPPGATWTGTLGTAGSGAPTFTGATGPISTVGTNAGAREGIEMAGGATVIPT
jgi:hypothetical protein